MDILGQVANGAVGGLLGGIGTLAKDIRQAITGDLPAEKVAEIQQKIMEIELSAQAGQMQINLEEARNEHLFVSGWRPFVGWVGGMSLAYAAMIHPFLIWGAGVCGITAVFPPLDTTITMQVLFGILGLGAFRSYDKKQAPSPMGKE